VRGVGLALLHSLWQGGVLALLLAGLLPLLRRQRAELRYAVAAGALGTLVLAVGLTFGWYYRSAPLAGAAPVAAASVAIHPALTAAVGVGLAPAMVPASTAPAAPLAWLPVASYQVERYLPLVVVAWLLGLLLMSGRLAGGLLYAGRLRRAGTQALGAEWQQRLAALAARAGLRQPVALLESARVAGPLVLGHLRPVILLPLGAVAGLSPSLLEALLAHELAHIVRRDYLLNLGLAVAEVLFFYHPAVWFMAHCLRAERENCCDDQAAALCGGDRLRVARALAALAELETAATPVPRLALAAAGGGRGSLLARVRRLALSRPQAPTLGEGLLAGSLTLLGLLGLSTGVVLAARPAQTVPTQTAPTTSAGDTSRRSAVVASPPLPPAPPLPATPPVPPVPTESVRQVERTVEAVVVDDEAPQRRRLRRLPPRCGQASTVVIEKDKKGRVVNLTVDGQSIETTTPGKKAKHGKAVRTVEVVRVPTLEARVERMEMLERPERPERPEAPEQRTFSFDFSTTGQEGEARRAAEQGLRETLRSASLSATRRRELEQELAQLRNYNAKRSKLQVRPELRNFHLDISGLSDNDRNTARHRLRYEVRAHVLTSGDAATRRVAAQAERNAEQAGRNAEQAARNATQAARNAELLEINIRRANLRARMAADAAELRALDGAGREQEVYDGPTTPPAPQPPQAPLPPAPPAAPNTTKLRDMLRNDGLVKDEKHFTFQLNDRGGRVDGKDLTPDQVAKYRQLLKLPTTKIKGSKSNYTISVDEN